MSGDRQAFPVVNVAFNPIDNTIKSNQVLGMTYREWLAGLAMQAIVSTNREAEGINLVGSLDKTNAELIAENAVFMADALIKTLEDSSADS